MKLLTLLFTGLTFTCTTSGSKYKTCANVGEAQKVHILIQDQSNRVSYKNIRIKELK